MTARPGGTAAPEREVLHRVAGALAARGYRCYLDPDGSDYFDLVVRRGDEVGLVEGKARSARNVLEQALVRRPWGDWVAVAVGSERAARSILERTVGRRAEVVGVWAVADAGATELRPPRRLGGADADGPFEATRARLRATLEQLDRGEVPLGVRWSGVLAEVARASGGRRFREWRLDEPGVG